MIALIGIIACLIACIGVPFMISSLRSGSAFKKTPEKRAEILTAMRKQFTMLSWVGLVLGAAEIGLYFISDPDERLTYAIAGVLWLVLSAECFYAKSATADVPLIAPPA
ncbi:MAG TPA: hypothetical protein VGG48_08450 [Rhizomicrobium sp.]|jgi:hypothetical protein